VFSCFYALLFVQVQSQNASITQREIICIIGTWRATNISMRTDSNPNRMLINIVEAIKRSCELFVENNVERIPY
jgi:hypothetical protein